MVTNKKFFKCKTHKVTEGNMEKYKIISPKEGKKREIKKQKFDEINRKQRTKW